MSLVKSLIIFSLLVYRLGQFEANAGRKDKTEYASETEEVFDREMTTFVVQQSSGKSNPKIKIVDGNQRARSRK